jgi:hypothetical protein
MTMPDEIAKPRLRLSLRTLLQVVACLAIAL